MNLSHRFSLKRVSQLILGLLMFGGVPHAGADCVTPPPEMVAWYPLDEITGLTAVDISTNSNNGLHTNAPTPVLGKVGFALSFDGIDDYVEIPDHPTLDFGTGNLSIDLWVKTTDTSGVKVLLDKRVEISSGLQEDVQGYSFYLSNGTLAFQMADDGNRSWWCSISATASCTNYGSGVFVADGQWHHVAVTVQRASMGGKFYVDGALVGSFDPSFRPGSLTNSVPLQLGRRSSSQTFLFEGALDEIELFSRELTASEVKAIYAADRDGKCKPPDEIVLEEFGAVRIAPNSVSVWWKTATERDTSKFVLWRGEPLNGKCTNDPTNYLNAVPLIEVSARGGNHEGSYYPNENGHPYMDVNSSDSSCYGLQEIENNGKWTLYAVEIK